MPSELWCHPILVVDKDSGFVQNVSLSYAPYLSNRLSVIFSKTRINP